MSSIVYILDLVRMDYIGGESVAYRECLLRVPVESVAC